jgi:hypothetical protein
MGVYSFKYWKMAEDKLDYLRSGGHTAHNMV